MFGVDSRANADRATWVVVDGERLRHPETVFFGTRSLLASWDEVGAHQLELVVEGPPGSRVDVHHEVTIGDHSVSVDRVPTAIVLGERPQVVQFEVVIHPLDAEFHARFDRLMKEGVATAEMYWPATDELRAAREHVPARRDR